MRKLIPFMFLAVLAGCSGGGVSGSDKKVIEEILQASSGTKKTADSMKFSDWDSTTYKDGAKTWKVVRVKYTKKPGGTGDEISNDVLIRYADKPLMPLDLLDNKAGSDWKKDVSSLKWQGQLTE